jgi:D-alanyl-D-alanine endopeptidase (penicillin-binding protein 7)
MKRRMISMLAAMAFVAGTSADVSATTQKKTTGVSKKPVKSVNVSRSATSSASRSPRARAAGAAAATVAGVGAMGASAVAVQSSAFLVQDQETGAVLLEKNAHSVLPIASITKLMTAMVTLDAQLGLNETLTVTDDDVDTLKGTRSRLRVGTQLSREEMLRLALMSSENRAASALGRHYPGGRSAFIQAMNQKAQSLGLHDTHFKDSTGLTSANVSSPHDLARLVDAAHQYPLIREFSTTPSGAFDVAGRTMQFNNTNSLVKSSSWEIGLSKTGYINEAGKCLVMQAWLNNKPVIIVLLDSWGKMTRIGDANRIKRWVESAGLKTQRSHT